MYLTLRRYFSDDPQNPSYWVFSLRDSDQSHRAIHHRQQTPDRPYPRRQVLSGRPRGPGGAPRTGSRPRRPRTRLGRRPRSRRPKRRTPATSRLPRPLPRPRPRARMAKFRKRPRALKLLNPRARRLRRKTSQLTRQPSMCQTRRQQSLQKLPRRQNCHLP